MALDYTVKYQKNIVGRFKKGTITNSSAGHDYDFTGARAVKIYSMTPITPINYGRGSTRFGTVSDAAYRTQEMLCSQAKSFTVHMEKLDTRDISIDATAGKFLKMEIDEEINPMLDKYRLKKWCMGAASLVQMASAPTTSTIVGDIIALKTAMLDNLANCEGADLYIQTTYYAMLLQADAVVKLSDPQYAGKAVEKGTVGMFEGLNVKPVPSSWLPTGCYFMIKCSHTSEDPVNLAQYDVIEKAVGFSGPVIQGLVYFDSFVTGERNVGVGVAGSSACVLSAATVTVTDHVATITAVTGVTFYYTDDGTDPRWSETRKTYSSGITLTSGMTPLRIIGEKDGAVSIEKTQAYA